MNKCSNCQTEFVGDVCPSCEGKLESATQMEKGSKLSNKAYDILSFIPVAVFVIFAILMVVFMVLLPVANINAFGLNEEYGSILSGTKFDEIAGLNSLSITLLVFALVTVIYAITLLIHKFSVLKYRKLFGNPLYKLLEVVTVPFVLAYLVFSIIIIKKINVADEGMGIIRVGFYPILTIISSIVCLLGVMVSMVLYNAYEKSNPNIKEAWEEERQKVKAEGKTSKAKKVANKAGQKFAKLIILPAVILIVLSSSFAITGIGNVVQRFEDVKPFDASELKQALIKDDGKFEIDRTTIESVIGKSYVPDGDTEDKDNVVYYTDNYISFLGKLERNQKYSLLAIEQGDYRISGLLKQAKNLEIEQETLAYGKAEINYSSGYVTGVVYNNIIIDGFSSITKKLDKVEIFKVVEVYSDQTHTTNKVEKVAYWATYSDGSFIYGTCENVAVVLEDGTVTTAYEGSYVGKTIRWQDEFGEYEVVAPANKN